MSINPKSVQRREIERLTAGEMKMMDRYRSAKIKLQQINWRSILVTWPIIYVNLVVPCPLETLSPYKKYGLVTKGEVKMAVLT